MTWKPATERISRAHSDALHPNELQRLHDHVNPSDSHDAHLILNRCPVALSEGTEDVDCSFTDNASIRGWGCQDLSIPTWHEMFPPRPSRALAATQPRLVECPQVGDDGEE